MVKPVKANKAPTAIALSHPVVTENDSGAVIGVIKVADPDDDTATLTVDDSRFEIVTTADNMYLRLKTGVSLDFEASPVVTLNITATDGAGNTFTRAIVISVTDVNEAPALNLPPTAVSLVNAVTSLDENAVIGTGIKVADIVVTDDALGSETLTLSGADAASFQIRNGNQLFYVGTSPNYEAKSSYAVTVNADDPTVGGNPDASKNFTLVINDVNEAPTAVSLVNAVTSLDENAVIGTGIKVADIVVTDDALGSETLTLSGADAASFQIRNGNQLFYVGTSPNYEAKSSYAVTVNADDPTVGGNPDASKNFTLVINDVNEAPTAVSLVNAVTSLDENAVIGTGIKVANIVVTDDALGSETLTLSGADAASFQIRNGNQLFYVGTSPNYEAKSSYAVTVNADDPTVGGNPDASKNFTLVINDINEAPIISAGAPSAELVEATSSSAGVAVAAVHLTLGDPDGTTPTYDLMGWADQGSDLYMKDGVYGYAILDLTANQLTYHLDNARAATEALSSSDPPVTDAFTIRVSDGSLPSSTGVTFTIHGADDAAPLTVTWLTEPVSGPLGSTQTFWNADGTKFFLLSSATLTADDNNAGDNDAFAYDFGTGEKSLLSASVAGGVEGYSYVGGLRSDGSKAIVQTDSTLTPDDTDGGNDDAFAYDFGTGQTTLLSGPVAGREEGSSVFGGFSPDGSKAIIESAAALTGGDTDHGLNDLFAYDFATGAKTLLTPAVAGGVDGYSYFAALSPDGSKAIIVSDSTLTADDTNGGSFDLFAYDFATGAKTLLSASIPGGVENYSSLAGWSPDGSKLIIGSTSTLTADDTGGDFHADLFAHDFGTGQNTLLTGSVAGGSDGDSYVAGWAPDGGKLIIGSASTLTADDTNGGDYDLFAYDFATGENTLLTGSIAGGVEGYSYLAGISPDGSRAVIASASTLTPDDSNSSDSPDLFAYDFGTREKTLLAGSGAAAVSRIAGWSADGSKAIIQSAAALTAGDTDGGNYDLFVYDFVTRLATLLTGSVAGGYDGDSDLVYSMPNWSAKWSADGNSVAIVTDSTLSLNDLDNGGPDVYWVNATTGAAALVDLGIVGVPGEQSWGEASSDAAAILVGISNPYTGTDYYLLA